MGEAADKVRVEVTTPDDTANGGTTDNADQDSQSADEIRAGIEHTRADMSETIDAIQDKISPEHIKQQVRDATIGKAQQLAHTVGDKAEQVAHAVSEKAAPIAHTVSEKVAPLAQTVSEKAPEVTRRGAEIAGQVAHTASDVAHTAGDKAKAAGSTLKEKAAPVVGKAKNNPLPAALITASALALTWFFIRKLSSPPKYDLEVLDVDD
jgi:Protein of unknown function (DUF3618)